ncbi:hypothetical protein P7C70_g5343, partial [Phenoliferia sp. Uapishka_3]
MSTSEFAHINGQRSECKVCQDGGYANYACKPASIRNHLKSVQHRSAVLDRDSRRGLEDALHDDTPAAFIPSSDQYGDDYGNDYGDGYQEFGDVGVASESETESEPERVAWDSDSSDDGPELFNWDEYEGDSDNGSGDSEVEEAEMNEFLRQAQEQASSDDYAPWPNRAFLLCDLITRLPRQRLSRSLQKILWWWAEELGAKGLPSPKVLGDFQKKMLETHKIGAAPLAHEGVLGNITYCADLKTLFSQNLSNPAVLKVLHLRPEDTEDNVRGLWQGQKWARELSAQLVAPMISAGGQHYYLDELMARRVPRSEVDSVELGPGWDPGYFMPRRWVFENGEVEAQGYPVVRHIASNEFYCQVDGRRPLQISSVDFVNPFPKILEARNGVNPLIHVFDDEGVEMGAEEYGVNEARVRAQGLRVVAVPASLYGDGCGGIKGSSWDEHTVWYMSLVGLEPEALGQEFHLHFLATSNAAHEVEMLTAIVDDLLRANAEGIVARFPAGTLEDQPEDEDVLIDLFLHFMEGDNPFHNMASSTPLLSKATFFCRMGKVTLPIRCRDPELIKAYMTLEGCPPRDFAETAKIARGVFDKAAEQGGTFSIVTNTMRNEGVKDWLNYTILERTLAKERAAGIAEDAGADVEEPSSTDGPLEQLIAAFREMLEDESDEIDGDEHFFNPLYRLIESMEFDAHHDTPIEILHTFLLGFFKYLWRHITTEVLKRHGARAKADLGARLSSLSVDGLKCSPLRGPKLVAYAQSLIGRDLKILGQLALFAIEPYATSQELGMWTSLMHLSSLVWYPVVPNMTSHCAQIDVAVAAFLAATVLTDIDWLNRRKFHLPIHMARCFQRIGPALLASTQKQESYNGVFREHSTYSSKRNPGYEIGLAFAHHNRFQHVISGGYFRAGRTGKWRQAGSKARELFSTNPRVRGLLGMKDDVKNPPGHLVFRLAPPPDPAYPDVRMACSITSHETLEPCYHKSFILVQDSPESPITIARIVQIGRLISTHRTVVQVERFRVHDHCWSLDMPRIRSRQVFTYVPPSSILAPVNVQHDCVRLGCEPTTPAPEIGPEGQKSSKRRMLMTHEPESDYIVNTSSLRNGRLLHSAFPRPPRPIPPLDELMATALEHQVGIDQHKDFLKSEKARKARELAEKKVNGGAAAPKATKGKAGKKSGGKGKAKAAESDESEASDPDARASKPRVSRAGRAYKAVVKNLPEVVKKVADE